MTLYINTTQEHDIEIAIKDNGKLIVGKKFFAKYSHAEKLLPAIDKLLKNKNLRISDIKKIKVASIGSEENKTSFTALRIGVVTANALGYALGVPVEGESKNDNNFDFDIVKPVYSREPNITKSKKRGINLIPTNF